MHDLNENHQHRLSKDGEYGLYACIRVKTSNFTNSKLSLLDD